MYNKFKIYVSFLHLIIFKFTSHMLTHVDTHTTSTAIAVNNLAEGQMMPALDLLQPFCVQQKTQKYSSLLLSHTSIPSPRFTFVSLNPHGPRPHSLLRLKPFWAVKKENYFNNKVLFL